MENYPPFSFLNEQNQLDGFDVDVTKAVAEKLGVKLKLETPSWEVIAAGRWNGRYDVCICSIDPQRGARSSVQLPVRVITPRLPWWWSMPVTTPSSRRSTSPVKKYGVGSASTYEAYLAKDLVIEGASKPIDYPFKAV